MLFIIRPNPPWSCSATILHRGRTPARDCNRISFDPYLPPSSETMKKPTHEQWARIGIGVQFLALVRTLAEVFRLEHVSGGRVPMETVLVYVEGGLIAAVLCGAAVALYFFRRYIAAVAMGIATVILLLIVKFTQLG